MRARDLPVPFLLAGGDPAWVPQSWAPVLRAPVLFRVAPDGGKHTRGRAVNGRPRVECPHGKTRHERERRGQQCPCPKPREGRNSHRGTYQRTLATRGVS